MEFAQSILVGVLLRDGGKGAIGIMLPSTYELYTVDYLYLLHRFVRLILLGQIYVFSKGIVSACPMVCENLGRCHIHSLTPS